MNSDQRDTPEDILSFEKDITIDNFKELERAVHVGLFPPNQDGISSNVDSLTSPKIVCVISPYGHEDDCDTHVSLHCTLTLWQPFSRVHWSAVISIINVDGDAKFLRSLDFEETFMNSSGQSDGVTLPVPTLYCPLFLERRLLLDDEEENLPGGALTLRFEIEIRYELEKPEILKWAFFKKHLMFKTHMVHGYSCGLNLNSSICPTLCEESTYFRDTYDLFASEDEWHYISDNLVTFADMLFFVENKKLDHVINSSSLIRLYELANKYEMENLVDQCRKLMIETMKPDFAAKVLVLAYKYVDKELKDTCFNYINLLSVDEHLLVKKDLEALNAGHIIAELF